MYGILHDTPKATGYTSTDARSFAVMSDERCITSHFKPESSGNGPAQRIKYALSSEFVGRVPL